MTVVNAATLFLAMAVLALTPDASAAAVAARSASAGIRQGLAVVAGIVAGDVVYIAVVFSGWSVLAEAGGVWFSLIQAFGGAYLIAMGAAAIVARPGTTRVTGWTSGFLTGLLITLGDPKAIVFYLSFLPAYFDFTAATAADALAVCLLAALAVGSVKGAYAVLAGRARHFLTASRPARALNIASGLILIATAVVLLRKA